MEKLHSSGVLDRAKKSKKKGGTKQVSGAACSSISEPTGRNPQETPCEDSLKENWGEGADKGGGLMLKLSTPGNRNAQNKGERETIGRPRKKKRTAAQFGETKSKHTARIR